MEIKLITIFATILCAISSEASFLQSSPETIVLKCFSKVSDQSLNILIDHQPISNGTPLVNEIYYMPDGLFEVDGIDRAISEDLTPNDEDFQKGKAVREEIIST